jgi:O-antigen ligase
MPHQNEILMGDPHRKRSLRAVEALSSFAFFAAVIASLSVLANDFYYFKQGPSLTWVVFVGSFFLAIFCGRLGFQFLLVLFPLVGGLHNVLTGFLKIDILALPNAGLDLAAGFYLGMLAKWGYYRLRAAGNNHQALLPRIPWPIALVVLSIGLSTAIAISRNLFLSATSTSLFGILYNLMHFRPIGWRDDFMPLGDFIAYALGAGLIGIVIAQLKAYNPTERAKIIFPPLMIGLVLASLMSMAQSMTGISLPEALLGFRNDRLGFAAIGFQPDIHAHAGHMLFGVIGLLGYLYFIKDRVSKALIILAIAFSWVGLILSKSRASLFFAFLFVLLMTLIFLWNKQRKLFWIFGVGTLIFLCGLFVSVHYFHDTLQSFPVVGWLVEFLDEAKKRDLTLIRNVGGLLGSRFEIFTASFNMFSAYPLMGVGQGNFYRLSSILDFSKSYLLVGNGGENAHNYFLQVLAENGFIGFVICAFAVAYPFWKARDKKILWPAGIALMALFVGNIYSHSFLVRENFMIAGVILALCYSYVQPLNQWVTSVDVTNAHRNDIQGKKTPLSAWVVTGLLSILLVGGLREAYQSFGRYPFTYGVDCFIDRPLTDDLWTSGRYEFPLLERVDTIELKLGLNRPYQAKSPLQVQFDLVNPGNKVNHLQSIGQSQSGEVAHFVVELPVKAEVLHPVLGRLSVSTCFTPRNLGINTDGRRLGVQMLEPIVMK